MPVARGAPAGQHLVERQDARLAVAVERDHVPQRGQLVAHRGIFSSWCRSETKTGDSAGVAQDVLDLLGGQGGVDRDVGAARGEAGVVGDGPLGPVLRQDRHPVARPDAELQEAEAEVLHLVGDRR